MPGEFQALSIGARAARLLRQRTDWTIAATFEHSFYIRSGDAFVCIGDAGIGDGPLNVSLPSGVIPGLGLRTHCATTPMPGIAARWVPAINAGMTAVGGRDRRFELVLRFENGARLAANDARIWHSPPWPVATSDVFANDRSEMLLVAATSAAPPESFLHAVTASRSADALGRRAVAGIASLRAAMADPQKHAFDAAVASLAGLGHGLTPSGDDVLAGALLMLHALGGSERADALADAVRRIAPSRTSPLSFALLEPACDGEANAAVANAIMALLEGRPVADVVRPLSLVGATSGFDILAGMLIAAGT